MNTSAISAPQGSRSVDSAAFWTALAPTQWFSRLRRNLSGGGRSAASEQASTAQLGAPVLLLGAMQAQRPANQGLQPFKRLQRSRLGLQGLELVGEGPAAARLLGE